MNARSLNTRCRIPSMNRLKFTAQGRSGWDCRRTIVASQSEARFTSAMRPRLNERNAANVRRGGRRVLINLRSGSSKGFPRNRAMSCWTLCVVARLIRSLHRCRIICSSEKKSANCIKSGRAWSRTINRHVHAQCDRYWLKQRHPHRCLMMCHPSSQPAYHCVPLTD